MSATYFASRDTDKKAHHPVVADAPKPTWSIPDG